MPGLRRAAAPMLALAVLLAGCTGEDPEPEESREPTGTVAPSPTPSPTATPTPTEEPIAAPEPPAELERTDEVGAAAAAEYFLGLYSYTMQTGDVEAWDAMSAEGCGFCARTRDFALQTKAAGDSFTGAEITPVETFVHPLDTLVQAYPVDVDFTQASAEHRSANGEVIDTSPADSGTFGVDIAHVSTGWRVLAVTAQDSQ